MSAFIVNQDHINIVVSYFIRPAMEDRLYIEIDGYWKYMGTDTAARAGEILYKENLRSVNARYDENTEGEYQFKQYDQAARAYKIGEIAGALDCLEYQSCESDDYRETKAFEIITAMRKQLLKELQTRELGDEKTWEISAVKSQFHTAYEE